MKYMSKIKSCLFFLSVLTSFLTVSAEKIDDTHYRFPIMADFELEDQMAVDYEKRGYQLLESCSWKVLGTNAAGLAPLGEGWPINQFFQALSPGSYIIQHTFYYKSGGLSNKVENTFYVDIITPRNLWLGEPNSLSSLPNPCSLLNGQTLEIVPQFKDYNCGAKTLPEYPNRGSISITFKSSDSDVVSVSSNGVCRAKSLGSADITVTAFARNTSHAILDTYIIDEKTLTINVMDPSEPSSFMFESEYIAAYIGQRCRLEATIIGPRDWWTITSPDIKVKTRTLSTGAIRIEFYTSEVGNYYIKAISKMNLPDVVCNIEVIEGFDIDGMRYDIESDERKEARVVYNSRDKYSGDIFIPAEIEYNGQVYNITKPIG